VIKPKKFFHSLLVINTIVQEDPEGEAEKTTKNIKLTKS
jgi:hypothetical protein